MADAKFRAAERADASSRKGFYLFSSKSSKLEEVADMYEDAAKAYRVENNPARAGSSYEHAATIHLNDLSQPVDAARLFLESSRAYNESNDSNHELNMQNYADAARTMESAVNLWAQDANFGRAATQMDKLAEIYDKKLGDKGKALSSLETAAGWNERAGQKAAARKCYLQIAELAAQSADYPKAITTYERAAEMDAESNVMRFYIKDYFMKAMLCHLVLNDSVASRRALEKYRSIDTGFASSPESAALEDLMTFKENGDTDEFRARAMPIAKTWPKDDWRRDALWKVEETIVSVEDDFS